MTPRFRVVAHVGSLDQPRAPRGRSFEGGGLSVSLHPKAWTSIAKLGGQETWVLRKDAPAFFEVPHPVPEEILAWGAASGFLEPTREFCFEVEDDEIGRTLVLTFATREAAGDEAEEHGAEVYERPGWRFGPKGEAYWHAAFGEGARPEAGLAESFCLMAWAEAEGFDGCWWDDVLDPAGLSAPRGVIFQSKLGGWSREIGPYPEGGPAEVGAEGEAEDDGVF